MFSEAAGALQSALRLGFTDDVDEEGERGVVGRWVGNTRAVTPSMRAGMLFSIMPYLELMKRNRKLSWILSIAACLPLSAWLISGKRTGSLTLIDKIANVLESTVASIVTVCDVDSLGLCPDPIANVAVYRIVVVTPSPD